MSLGTRDKIENEHLYRAFDLMTVKNYSAAEAELNAGLSEIEVQKDKVLSALFYSSLGVLYKIQKDYSKSWKFYEVAEKLLPEDPALKIISARLLIDVFGQFDAAIRRCRKVLEIARSDPAFIHQAHVTMGLAYLKKGDRAKSLQCLVDAMQEDFDGLFSAANIDLKLVEALLQKKVGLEESRTYLARAKSFAEDKKEEKFVEVYRRLLEALPT